MIFADLSKFLKSRHILPLKWQVYAFEYIPIGQSNPTHVKLTGGSPTGKEGNYSTWDGCLDEESFILSFEEIEQARKTNEQPFKVGDIVRLTIMDEKAEVGQWFETTVTGASAKSGILLNLEGFIILFSTDKGDGDGFGDLRIIDRGARFEPAIKKFCFYSSDDVSEDSADRQWDEFKASLELV